MRTRAHRVPRSREREPSRAQSFGHHRPPNFLLTGHTEIAEISVMTELMHSSKSLPSAIERFVLHWGDMGSEWGLNRSVGQIHALLYLADRPLTAEEIADLLGLARSNVSNSIKELLAWNLIRRVPIKRDRREHFEAETDLWEIVTRIVAGRKEREIDPAMAALQACVRDAEADPRLPVTARKRLEEMLDFVETMDRWYAQMITVPKPKIAALIRLGARVVRLLSVGRPGKGRP